MEDLFKKVLYAGIGLAATATEKLESTVEDLVKKGKISDSEAKKVVDEFFEKTKSKKDEFDDKFSGMVEKLGYVKAEELAALKKRVEELEAKQAKPAAAAKAKTA